MDVITANRIYDEIAMIIGSCLQEMGKGLKADQLALLATDSERNANIEDMACAMGRLVLDSNDLATIDDARLIQRDRALSLRDRFPSDPSRLDAYMEEVSDANARSLLLAVYLTGNMERLEHVHEQYAKARARRG